nr:hypothetical protein BaRGS_018723 [Batillaria attramentaria]
MPHGRVFLSGANAAWFFEGFDFGNNQYPYERKAGYENWITQIRNHGGNSIRVFLHDNCQTTPYIDDHNGHTYAPDKEGHLVRDLNDLLHFAALHKVYVFFVLFSGAQKKDTHWKLQGLIVDNTKRQAYVDNALKPIVRGVKNQPYLGGWEIMNEMEGVITIEGSGDACFDTSVLSGSGAGFAGQTYHPKQLLAFINHLTAAIKSEDHSALVTSGSWNPKSNTDSTHFGHKYHNFYSDHCLVHAGNNAHPSGKLDFFQIHTYAKAQGDHYDNVAPFYHSGQEKSVYGLSKPVVIGEFSHHKGDGWAITSQYNHAYYHGYAGAWAWQYKQEPSDHDQDDAATINRGLNQLKGKNDQSNGGLVTL